MNSDRSDASGLEGWRFSSRETCRGYWEVVGVDGNGRSVLRTGTMAPEILLEDCIGDAQELERQSLSDRYSNDNETNQDG